MIQQWKIPAISILCCISGVYESQKDKLQELFGTCKVITLEGADEFALLTEVLNEKQFQGWQKLLLRLPMAKFFR